MANYRQAPILEFDKDKSSVCSSFSQIPNNVMEIIFQKLGNKVRLMKIMLVLIGTKEGFAISEKYICQKACLDASNYRKARKELIEMGWITLLPSEAIRVNFSTILGEEPVEKNEEKIIEEPHIPTPVPIAASPPFRERDILGGETVEEYEHAKAFYALELRQNPLYKRN